MQEVNKTEHIVLFNLRDGITSQEKTEIVQRFLELKNSLKGDVPYILSIEYGHPRFLQGHPKGYDLAFRVVFNFVTDRDYYTGRPFYTLPGSYDMMHEAYKAFVAPYLKAVGGVLVFDYTTSFPVTAPTGRIDRLMFFKYNDKATVRDHEALEERIAAMGNAKRNGKPIMHGLDYGWQNSKEGLDAGFDLALRIAYVSWEACDYHTDEEPGDGVSYKAFIEFLTPLLMENGLLVFDYSAYSVLDESESQLG